MNAGIGRDPWAFSSCTTGNCRLVPFPYCPMDFRLHAVESMQNTDFHSPVLHGGRLAREPHAIGSKCTASEGH